MLQHLCRKSGFPEWDPEVKENSVPQITDPHCPQTFCKTWFEIIGSHITWALHSWSCQKMQKETFPSRSRTAWWKVKLQNTKPGRALVISGIDFSALPTWETEIMRGWVTQRLGVAGENRMALTLGRGSQEARDGRRWLRLPLAWVGSGVLGSRMRRVLHQQWTHCRSPAEWPSSLQPKTMSSLKLK